MAKIKYDVTDADSGQDFDTPIPTGVYKGRVLEIEDTVSSRGNDMLKVTLEIIKGDWKGRRLWDYIVLDESSEWKLRQFLEAVQIVSKDGKRTKGAFDTDKIEGTQLLIRVKHQTDDDFGTQAKVGSLQPMPEDEIEEEQEEEEEKAETEETEEDELTYDEVMEMDLDDLKSTIDDYELEDIRITKRSKVETVRVKVAEALELEAEEEDDPESWEDLEGMDHEALVIYAEETLELEVEADVEERDLREAIAEELEIEIPEEEEEQDYSDLSLDELKTEAKDRGLSVKGGKRAIIKRLEEEDKKSSGGGDDAEPF